MISYQSLGALIKVTCICALDLIVYGDPVVYNLVLRFLQGYFAGADLSMQVIFDFIFLVETRCGAGWLGPQIRNIIGTPQFQGNEVIDLVLAARVAGDPIIRVDQIFSCR